MKKMFLIGMVVMCFMFGNAFACEGPDCSGSGNFDISASADGSGFSIDNKFIPNGFSGGFGGANGVIDGNAVGDVVFFGKTSGSLNFVGGGITMTDAYKITDFPNFKIGSGSKTENMATVNGLMTLNSKGSAYAVGEFSGAGGQISLNNSFIGASNFPMWKSDGGSAAMATQNSFGNLVGVGGGLFNADVIISGGFTMNGMSVSETYRQIEFDDGVQTETFHSNGYASTDVNSAYFNNNQNIALSNVSGKFTANGSVVNNTIMKSNGNVAQAASYGSYSGAGVLGCNFNGVANGYSGTTNTTFNGFNGNIMGAYSGMSVSVNYNSPD